MKWKSCEKSPIYTNAIGMYNKFLDRFGFTKWMALTSLDTGFCEKSCVNIRKFFDGVMLKRCELSRFTSEITWLRFFDHSQVFMKLDEDGYTEHRVLVTQPYVAEDCYKELEEWCDKYDLSYVMYHTRYSWCFPNASLMIMIMSKQTREYFDAEIKAWGEIIHAN